MVTATICPRPYAHHVLLYCKCVLNCRDKCPNMVIPSQEVNRDTTNTCSKIYFYVYRNVSHCKLHVSCPYKELTTNSMCSTMPRNNTTEKKQMERACVIRDINYIISREFVYTGNKKLAFNFTRMRILGTHHCGKARCEEFKIRG